MIVASIQMVGLQVVAAGCVLIVAGRLRVMRFLSRHFLRWGRYGIVAGLVLFGGPLVLGLILKALNITCEASVIVFLVGLGLTGRLFRGARARVQRRVALGLEPLPNVVEHGTGYTQ